MHRLTVVALTLLLIIASILPPVLARETNAERLARGYPPLPPARREPTRRDTAKRGVPSSSSQTVSGVIEVRDQAGSHRLGFVLNDADIFPVVGVTDPAHTDALKATFASATSTLQATNLNFKWPPFSAPYFLGSTFPDPSTPDIPPPEGCPLTIVPDSPGAHIWSYNSKTNELTIAFTVKGGTVPAGFAWDQKLNELEIVTSWPAPNNDLPVRLYLVT